MRAPVILMINSVIINLVYVCIIQADEYDQDTASGYQQECVATLDQARTLFAGLEAIPDDKSIDSVLFPLNKLEVLIDKGYNKAQLYYSVHPDIKVREVAESCEQDFSQLVTRISLSRPLYEAVKSVNIDNADADTRRYVKNTLRDFRRAGVNQDDATRKYIKQLREELVKLGQEFDRNIREDIRFIELTTVNEMDGLPQDYIESHQPDVEGKIILTTDYPDYIPFMSYASNDKLRYEYYLEFKNRGYPKNEPVLKSILDKRYELAKILGYKNYADYITEDKMIKNASNVHSFIDKISAIAGIRANHDYQILLHRLKQIDPAAVKVGDWQKSYLMELIKREQYQFDSKLLRQYFAYEKVRDGIFQLVNRLFNVTIVPWETGSWDESVERYEMWEDGRLLGRFYLDMQPREGKFKHAAHFPVQTGLKDKQLPIAALVCNFPGGGNGSDLMDHSQVKTFLHEFGHLLHHIFSGKQKWLAFSGVSTEWDFVEAPSQMLEEWVWDADSLKLFAINAMGQTIPHELIDKMNAARYFGRGLWVKNQMFYAATSLNYYNRQPDSFDLRELMIKMQQKYSPYDYVENTHFYANFGHLEGYSAMYYTYMWSLVIANDLFSEFRKYGLQNTRIAQRYRDRILAPGGSRDAAELVEGFLGRPYNFEAFENELNRDRF